MQNQLSDFIQQARSKKIADEEIVKILLDQGWSFSQIETNMSSSSSFNGLVPPKPTESIASNLGMWDSFQHILMFISLYVMSTAIALLLNYFVDKWLPGVTANSYYSYGGQNSFEKTLLSGYSASLIVSFPFFAFFFITTNKRKIEIPEIINLRWRKILIYFTLIITFIIMVSHLIVIVFQFLNGNVSTNALLHFMVTILVSGSIFGHYIYEIRQDRKKIE
ncbi:MAG: hypothetical protein COX79_02925 [Candidatus Levybacteria bacterium CG_4_10_14_0_2_um_filter_36_16]|nr:MAG: hypothetical protein AUK12_01145 [Candidatus Levybacteria bacterium CG2_30_37_29]PIR79588.1 MAG: hypothetical protein COU26_00345 [Candidatus Levybacteria bacterium CG10_big_fil_rev_8_21_14_0_10_36_30]PIZ97278.1 MAG: hypothetical protein COX79_02925 [Candidatus Levybacteria bacterium CG_4_10_14_0_2_um_filter_36_16]PJA90942.1 MAG: hypothetical protein CO136_00045 [Candidatus Levybacteria bacterium CG_4_9_14_3_um_filter_36_7]